MHATCAAILEALVFSLLLLSAVMEANYTAIKDSERAQVSLAGEERNRRVREIKRL